MAVYRTTFPIVASPEAVWEVLTDFERYPEWNPSLPSISGELRPGSTVSLTLAMPGRPSPKVSAIQRHHDALNVALTERAEGRAPSTSP